MLTRRARFRLAFSALSGRCSARIVSRMHGALDAAKPAAGLLHGLPPHIRDDCRVLVLGSMPGNASLRAARYYAHPRNRFWPLMAALCGFDPALDYPARIAAVQAHGVGLWDVIGRCRRSGSLDAAIERGSETANPLAARIAALPHLRAVAFNGGKAAQAFARHVVPALPPGRLADEGGGIALLPLPSTSPANAAMDLARLHRAWAGLRPWLQCG